MQIILNYITRPEANDGDDARPINVRFDLRGTKTHKLNVVCNNINAFVCTLVYMFIQLYIITIHNSVDDAIKTRKMCLSNMLANSLIGAENN